MTRVAIYARVSTKEQDDYGTSLLTQLQRMRDECTRNGYTIVTEQDEDFSGRTADRPKMNKIKEMALRGEIDAIMTYSRDRYARSRLAGMMLDLVFRNANVKRLYATREESLDTPQGHLRDGFDDLMHEYEVENFVERSQRGKLARAEQGIIIGMGRTPIYGYKRVRRDRIKDIAINDEEVYSHPTLKSQSDIVLWIFTQYVDGLGVTELADTLNAYGLPARLGGRWTPPAIYDILHQDEYRGQFYANKYRKEINPKTGKKAPVLRPREEWISIQREDLRIVSDEIFFKVGDRRDTSRGGYALKYEYLFSRRVTCHNNHRMCCHCTRGTPTKRYQYYECYKNKFSIKKCDLRWFSAPRVDEVVWRWVTELTNEPEVVLQGMQEAQRKALEDNAGAISYVENCNNLLDKENRELAYLIEEAKQFKDSPRIREQYRTQIEQCNQRIEILERERAKYEEQAQRGILTDDEIDRTVDEIKRLRVALRKLGELTFEHRRRWIEILNIHIVLGQVDGRKYVDIVWYETTDRRFLDEETSGLKSETSTGLSPGSTMPLCQRTKSSAGALPAGTTPSPGQPHSPPWL